MQLFSVSKKNERSGFSLRRVWCLRFGIEQFLDPERQYAQQLTELGLHAGLHRVGIASAAPLTSALVALRSRKEHGHSDTMQFTFRNPVRSTTPQMAVPGARSIIVGARSYFADVALQHLPNDSDNPSENTVLGDVARYAWSDHYRPLRDALRVVVKKLRKDGHRAVLFADDNSVVDREVAYRAGLGWYGKNANLLLSGTGSWFVLGSIITTAVLPPGEPVADGCGSCRRCIDACPTGAIVEPGVIDARRCLAWVMQKPGVVPLEFRQAIGSRIYGCDDCQDACPPTMRLAQREPLASDAQMSVDVITLLSMTDSEIENNYGRWYIHNREVRWVRRNALIVLGNCASLSNALAHTTVIRYLSDSDPYLRAHATWAAARLSLGHYLNHSDPDSLVQNELARLPEPRRQH